MNINIDTLMIQESLCLNWNEGKKAENYLTKSALHRKLMYWVLVLVCMNLLSVVGPRRRAIVI